MAPAITIDAVTHDCSNYPVATCAWCEKSSLVARWWLGVRDNFYDPIPLSLLPIDILAEFLDFFDAIVDRELEQAVTEEAKGELADLYDVGRMFIDELRRRNDDYQLERACAPGWRPAC